MSVSRYAGNTTLSVIVRCHDRERLPFLEQAVFSLSIQEWSDLELVVVIQNGDEDFVHGVRDLIRNQPWRRQPNVTIQPLAFEPGVDGRSSLLTYGIGRSTGRFLAFLDDDDVVYHHGYTTLIRRLMDNAEHGGGPGIAVGGCRVAKSAQGAGHWYIRAKETPFTAGRSRLDLFHDNFIPIHSYVIDRAVVAASDLYFDDAMPPLEDYEFLLRLAVDYEFDFSSRDVFVCEYRYHASNSLPSASDATPEQVTKHRRAAELIDERKRALSCLIPVSELAQIGARQAQLEREVQLEAEAQLEREAQLEEARRPEDSRIVGQALSSLEEGIYDFFLKHPKTANRLSRTVRRARDAYRRSHAATHSG